MLLRPSQEQRWSASHGETVALNALKTCGGWKQMGTRRRWKTKLFRTVWKASPDSLMEGRHERVTDEAVTLRVPRQTPISLCPLVLLAFLA